MERLKKLRENIGLSQQELSKIFEINQNTLSRYERGERQPDFDMLTKIANYFDVSTDYLLGIDEKKATQMSGIDGEIYEDLNKLSPEQLTIVKALIKELKANQK